MILRMTEKRVDVSGFTAFDRLVATVRESVDMNRIIYQLLDL